MTRKNLYNSKFDKPNLNQMYTLIMSDSIFIIGLKKSDAPLILLKSI